jgi:hypothetical protein
MPLLISEPESNECDPSRCLFKGKSYDLLPAWLQYYSSIQHTSRTDHCINSIIQNHIWSAGRLMSIVRGKISHLLGCCTVDWKRQTDLFNCYTISSFLVCSQDNSVGSFPSYTASEPALGPTQPPIQRVPGFSFARMKRPGRETYHSPPSNVKNCGAIPLLPHTSPWRGA